MITVYTGEEVADLLKVEFPDILQAIDDGLLKAFKVAGQLRIREEALLDFMEQEKRPMFVSQSLEDNEDTTTSHVEARQGDAGSMDVHSIRDRIFTNVRQIAPDVRRIRLGLLATDKRRLVVRTAGKKTGLRPDYWLGFKASILDEPQVSHLIIGLPEVDVVFPIEPHRRLLQALSESAQGQKEFHIDERSGEYFMLGKSISVPYSLKGYINDFASLT